MLLIKLASVEYLIKNMYSGSTKCPSEHIFLLEYWYQTSVRVLSISEESQGRQYSFHTVKKRNHWRL